MTVETERRDEFGSAARDTLAKRAGFLCSFPGCRRLTVGPSEDRESRLSMVGVAAHITAASALGPRYDATLSTVERSSDLNGIWMCQTHAKLIDDNPSTHTVVEIQRWKRQHEDWVFSRVAKAENYVRNGVAKFSLSDVGPFRARCAVKLGRHNVIYGLNDSGKSTFCETIAAFSGGSNYERFADRFNFCRDGSRSTMVEVGVSRNESLTTVNLSQQAFQVKGKQKNSSYRIHVEINGNVAAHWQQMESCASLIVRADIGGSGGQYGCTYPGFRSLSVIIWRRTISRKTRWPPALKL